MAGYYLPLLYTALVGGKVLNMETLVRLTSTNPARVLGDSRRGGLEPGMVADLLLFDPECCRILDETWLGSGAKNTPLLNQELQGEVVLSIVAGEVRYRTEDF